MNRHTARETAFQVIFQMDMNDIDPITAIQQFLETTDIDTFLQTLVEGVVSHKVNIDETISSHLEKWTIDRIARVEKTILRIAVYEILFIEDIPESVSVNEAVELAKTFGDEDSSKFVNGVLSKILA
ncbi:N utilization substance protein B like protein [Lentibacillus sp. JNUCC-1]|uniref:transcription antitermination factor NusB n=1 Tax=Lentibacillus sp. JNUCC-1 TaxID=2654513 RepID=UPI0012E77531|nr:transcription antitermination factor NusB [Lentibacillus sp. JNUCC-1]MUV39679.1 N utilization substance protein B like protein [Lentibacillus sp. JNUCC-1]